MHKACRLPKPPGDPGSLFHFREYGRPPTGGRRVILTCHLSPAKSSPSEPVRKASGWLGRVTPAALMRTVPVAAP